MPNFTIRRRRKKVEDPPSQAPPKEEKIDHSEEYMSDSSDETAIDNAMRDLKVAPLERTQKQPQYRQTEARTAPKMNYSRPRSQNPANVARQPPIHARYQNQNPTRPRIPDQYQRRPTMAIQNPRSKMNRGAPKMRYSSHYGSGGEHLDTHTKSLMLYNHCFG